MANRHLDGIPYSPQSHGFNTRGATQQNAGQSSFGTASQASISVPKADPQTVIVKQKFTDSVTSSLMNGMMTALFIPLLLRAMAGTMSVSAGTVADENIKGMHAPTAAIKVLRAATANEALQRARSYAPELGELVKDWHSGERVHVEGVTPEVVPFFVPIPRPGYKAEIERLRYAGFAHVHLNLYFPPLTISTDALRKRLAHWARRCRVKVQWIHRWSTFASSITGLSENHCKAGGMCVGLSYGTCSDEITLSEPLNQMST